MAACTDVQPVVKIGLVAPFEGLYRRTGYDALAAMRAAIADQPAPGVNVLPLAWTTAPILTRRSERCRNCWWTQMCVPWWDRCGHLWRRLCRSHSDPAEIPWFLPYDPSPRALQPGAAAPAMGHRSCPCGSRRGAGQARQPRSGWQLLRVGQPSRRRTGADRRPCPCALAAAPGAVGATGSGASGSAPQPTLPLISPPCALTSR